MQKYEIFIVPFKYLVPKPCAYCGMIGVPARQLSGFRLYYYYCQGKDAVCAANMTLYYKTKSMALKDWNSLQRSIN